MTAVVLATLVEQHKLTWETTTAQAFPAIAPKLPSELREVTLACLLAHRAGLPHDADWMAVSRAGSLHQQRLAALASLASVPLLSPPGSKYSYSNLGYVIAGAMAEEATGETWEHLVARIVFQPLGMRTAGFGGMGTPGRFDQPWQHRLDGDLIMKNGPTADNPPVLGPAGTVHCSIGDWASFIADQLRGLEGKRSLLSPASCQAIHQPAFGGDYAGGWIVLQRSWGGGTVYTHSGSNRLNYSVAWMAPKRDFAVLVCTNEFADDSAQACDEVASGLVTMQLANSRGTPGRRRSRAN
jgi:CubicO group peptidase (beta-lactamase class C family)